MKHLISRRKKLLFTICSIFLFLVVTELSLRLLGFAYHSLQPSNPVSSTLKSDETRILCIGESTTAFGFENSYPSLLQKIFNQMLPHKKVHVINKGLPAANVKEIDNKIEKWLKEYNPSYVIGMMGINDSHWRADDAAGFKWWRQMRVYKVFKYIIKAINAIFINNQQKISLAPSKSPASISESDQNSDLVNECLNSVGERWLQECILFKKKKFTSARRSINQKLKQGYASSPYIYSILGLTYLELGEIKQAETALNKTFSGSADLIHNILHNLFFYTEASGFNNFSLLEKYLITLLKKQPKNLIAQQMLGTLYMSIAISVSNPSITNRSEYLRLAKEYLEKNIRDGNKDGYAFVNLAQIYITQKEYKRAEELLLPLVKNTDEMFLLDAYIRSLFAQKKYSKAISALKNAEGRFSNSEMWQQMYENECSNNPECPSSITYEFTKLWNKFTKKSEQINFSHSSYLSIVEKVQAYGAQFIAMQYPTKSIEPLKKLLEKYNVLYISNEQIFNKLIAENKYQDYFVDNFAGSFGHATAKGNKVIANNVFSLFNKNKLLVTEE